LNATELKNTSDKKFQLIKLHRSLLRFASIILIVVVTSVLTYIIAGRSMTAGSGTPYEIQVPYGSRSKVTLPDGSNIWLNAGSKLTYNRDFAIGSRDVYLEGEAFFNVTKGKQRFVVHTSHIDLQVFGTAFNVKSYPEEAEIEATLVEGSVQIRGKELAVPVILRPKEKLTYHKPENQFAIQTTNTLDLSEERKETIPSGSIKKASVLSEINIKEDVDTDESTSWKDGKLIINNEPLEGLAKKLGRKYDITFVFESEQLKKYTYSGTLRDFPLEQVLKAMELTSPIRYTIREKTVVLTDNRDFRSSGKKN
jgi:transmembrane sensor